VHAFRKLLSVIEPSGNASAAAMAKRNGVSGLMLLSGGLRIGFASFRFGCAKFPNDWPGKRGRIRCPFQNRLDI
jgi:hypothetical protein